MATRNKFNKTEIRDFLEVIANENEGYIKCAGNIIYNGNVNLTNKISTIESNIANIITTNNNQTSNITNLQTLQTADRSNITNLQNLQINDRANITNLQNLQIADRANITNNTSNIATINTTLNNCAKLNIDNSFLGNITFNYLPTTTITSFTNNNQFVSKGYVDSAISGTTNLAGSNFDWTGLHTFNVNLPTSNIVPNSSYQLVNKSYVDSVISSGSSSLFSQNNTWTNTNTFSNIVLNGIVLTNKFTTIDSNIGILQGNISNIEISLNNNTTTNNTQNSRLDAIELLNTSQNSNISLLQSNVNILQGNITSINSLLATNTTTNNTQNSRLDAIELLNTSQNSNIANNTSNISTLQGNIININSNLANCAKISQVNDFGTFTNTFNTIKVNTLSKTDAGTEIYTETPLRVNNTNFFYKQGSSYYKLGDKIDEKLNVLNGIASNLTINTANLNNSTFSGTVSGLTKTNVGLSNVDNTSDANKPVSTATQTQLNLKLNKTSDTLQYCNILNSTLTNSTFTGSTEFDNLKFNELQCNYLWFDATSGTPQLNISSSTPNIVFINSYITASLSSGAFVVNLPQLSSSQDGMIWTIRILLDIDWRLLAGSGVNIIDLSNSSTTNKLYQSKRCASFLYRHTGRRYYILSEN